MGRDFHPFERARTKQASFQLQQLQRCDLIGELLQIIDGMRELSSQFNAEAAAARERLEHISDGWTVTKAKAAKAAEVMENWHGACTHD